jgi:hypothetical protein
MGTIGARRILSGVWSPRRKDLFLVEHFAEAHVDAPLDLADGEERIDGLSDVVGDPDLLDRHDARLLVRPYAPERRPSSCSLSF